VEASVRWLLLHSLFSNPVTLGPKLVVSPLRNTWLTLGGHDPSRAGRSLETPDADLWLIVLARHIDTAAGVDVGWCRNCARVPIFALAQTLAVELPGQPPSARRAPELCFLARLRQSRSNWE
jgi:hypothetical protein